MSEAEDIHRPFLYYFVSVGLLLTKKKKKSRQITSIVSLHPLHIHAVFSSLSQKIPEEQREKRLSSKLNLDH